MISTGNELQVQESKYLVSVVMAENKIDPYTYLLGEVAVKEKHTRLIRKAVMNPSEDHTTNCASSPRVQSIPLASPTARLFSCHISVVPAFLDQISFPTYLQKNWRHPRAVQSRESDTKEFSFAPNTLILKVEEGDRNPKRETKIWVVVLVCKGTSFCVPAPQHGPTSPRRFCGYGLRLFSFHCAPAEVIIEEFGLHTVSGGDNDGWRFQPPASERVVLTPTMVMDAFRSFDRGIKPAKHLQVLAEKCALTNASYETDLLHAIQLCHRRYYYLVQTQSDKAGTHNISQHLRESSIFLFEFQHLRNFQQHWVMFLSHYDVACMAIEYGGDVIGLDATHNVTCYKNTYLFAIMGRCPAGAIPLGYFISTLKDEEAITVGLNLFKMQVSQCLHKCNKLAGDMLFKPKAICIDMDCAANNAIRVVFPTSVVVLCHYHFMVNMVNQARSGVHGLAKEDILKLMSSLRSLCSTRTVADFRLALSMIKSLSTSFYNYLNVHYLTEAWVDTFCEVNRTHLPLSAQRLCRSNMLTEVSFRTFKYIILGGVMNKRLDMLVYSIAYRLFPYFLSRIRVSKPPVPRFLVSLETREKGSEMFK
tara:strand:- start:2265 stop:4034 length:1770 start_codon:yes stop_codon:yes gene_type:complete